MDGLRAVAALWVAAHHAIIASEPTRVMAVPIIGPIVTSLFFGQCAVMVFLLLSGFCLYFPCVAKNPQDPVFTTGYGTYLKRRFTRIAPPYYWAGLLCLILVPFPQLAIGTWSGTVPVDAKVIASHLLFLHNLIPSHSSKIDYPMWSIGLEWQLYLLFPLMVWAFRKVNPWVVIGATFLLSGVIRVGHRSLPAVVAPILRDGPLSYLHVFGLGMVVAALTVHRKRIAPNWALGAVAIGGLLAIRLGSGGGLVHDTASAALAFAILLLATDHQSAVAHALSKPWLVALGVFSYSIYLIHAPLLHLAWYFLRNAGLSADVLFGILLLALGPIVAVCYAFHRLFERPFMRTPKAPSKQGTDASVPVIATTTQK